MWWYTQFILLKICIFKPIILFLGATNIVKELLCTSDGLLSVTSLCTNEALYFL